LNRNHLHQLPVRVPDRVVQTRIANTLSAYDDLMENNTRRISILEDMARRLFEEWFVNFRYPGVADFEGELPSGWELVELGSLCGRITDGAHHSPPSVECGKPMASVRDMRTWGLDYTNCRMISGEDHAALVKADCLPKLGDILIAKDGANLNKHTFLVWREESAVLLSSIAIIRPKPSMEREFLVAQLRSDSVSEAIKGMRTGAAIPRIILKDFKRLPLALPPQHLRRAFEKVAGPMHMQCRGLTDANTNLRATRDLLLPKLISGEIEVRAAEEALEAVTA
jgi:type I restriction enzyme S subunit